MYDIVFPNLYAQILNLGFLDDLYSGNQYLAERTHIYKLLTAIDEVTSAELSSTDVILGCLNDSLEAWWKTTIYCRRLEIIRWRIMHKLKEIIGDNRIVSHNISSVRLQATAEECETIISSLQTDKKIQSLFVYYALVTK
jgi:hypothetical protein